MAALSRNGFRALRSVLYMPASNSRALAKSFSLDADAFIYDLEDAVSPEHKDTARKQAVDVVSRWRGDARGDRKTKVIRINGRTTKWFGEDIEAVRKSEADAVLLPKAESPSDIALVDEALGGTKKLWAMIETPLGVCNAVEVARASPNLQCLVVGTVDLANELRCLPNAHARWNLMASLQNVLLAAKISDCQAIDGVYVDIFDDEGFREECKQGRELGFDGKSLIHPKTIAATNEAFSPSEAEIAKAQAVLQAYEEAKAKGSGVAVVDGKLVEELHTREATRVLELAALLQR